MTRFELNGNYLRLPLKKIPEAREWMIGETYTLKLKVKQTEISDEDVQFEILETTPLENPHKPKRKMMSDTGNSYG